MERLEPRSVDLTVCSPPYDNLRNYCGYSFNIGATVRELYRVTKRGGVVVWNMQDQTIKGSKSGSSFRHALAFMDYGFRLHEHIIFAKRQFSKPSKKRYLQQWENLFVFSKGEPSTFNGIKDRENKTAGHLRRQSRRRTRDGWDASPRVPYVTQELGLRGNVWEKSVGGTPVDYGHSAVMLLELAKDCVETWSNPGELVLDCCCGAGTTLLAAKELGRKFLGFDVSAEYVEIAKRRLKERRSA